MKERGGERKRERERERETKRERERETERQIKGRRGTICVSFEMSGHVRYLRWNPLIRV